MPCSRALPLAVLVACNSVTLDERTCPFNVHPTQVKGTTYRCGFVDMGNSKNTHVRVAVLVFLSQVATNAKLAPIFELSGGPSQSWANLGLDKVGTDVFAGAANDYVFVEQRGTGVSEPSLSCLEEDKTLRDCANRLAAAGADPQDFTTPTLADDVERVRQALGYKDIVLLGTSYGTTWARGVIARHGAHVQSVVLNSVVAATFPLLDRLASATDEAFTALFKACADDPTCNANAPDLETRMLATIDNLGAAPLKDSGGKVVLDKDDFILAARSILSSAPEDVPSFLLTIEQAVTDGGLSSQMQGTVDQTTHQTTVDEAAGQYYSVFCSDAAGATREAIGADLAKVRPAFRATLGGAAYSLLDDCASWPYGDGSIDSTVYKGPTLLLVGQFDPRTPPSFARDALKTLSNAQLVVVPGQGHDVASSSECVRKIVGKFIGGNDTPDVTCTTALTTQFNTAIVREGRAFAVRHGYKPLDLVRY